MRKWLQSIAMRIAEPLVIFACPPPTKEKMEEMKRWQTPLSDEIRDTPAPPRPPQRSESIMSEQNNGIEYSITVNHNLDDVESRLDRIVAKLERAVWLQKQLENMEDDEPRMTPQEMVAKFKDAVTHPDSLRPMNAEKLYGFLYVRRGMSFTGRYIPVFDQLAWERAREMLLAEFIDQPTYVPNLRDWLDNTVYPRIKVVNT